MSLTSAVLTVLFDAAERPKALTIWVTASALGIPLGPLAGGWLLDTFWWGSVFLVNVPMVLAGLIAVVLWVPESHGDRARRFDPAGIALSAVGLGVLTYGVIEAGERGWTDPRSMLTAAAGAAVLALFVAWQRRAQAPLVDLALFRSRSFTWGAVLATVASFGMFGLLFALPQFFQAVGGNDALGTGLRLLPVIGGLLVGARLAGRLEPRLGAKILVTTGLVLMAAGLFAGSATGPGTGYGYVATWVSVAGVGLGFTLPPAMNAALGALSPMRSGVGSGLIQAMRQVGGAIGVTVLGTVLNGAYREQVDVSGLSATAADAVRDSATAGTAVAGELGDPVLLESVHAAFTAGMDLALLVAGAIAVGGAVLSLLFLPARPAPPHPAAATRPPETQPVPAQSVV
jgi:EmrB/QacA subfamily drug resistance transporter